MKKTLSCILVLALFLSLGVFGGWNGRALADAPEDRVGTYVMTELVMDGKDYTELLKSSGTVFALELHEDGTCLLIQGEDARSLTWDEENIYTEDGIPLPYLYENGTLVLTEEGVQMTFQKVEDEKQPEKPEVTDQSILGIWIAETDLAFFLDGETDPGSVETLKAVPLQMVLELRSDGTYILSMDSSALLSTLRDSMRGYMESLLAESGMTVEQYEALTGGTLDEALDETFADVDFDLSDLTNSGSYKREEDRLTLTNDSGRVGTGTLDGSTLTFDQDSLSGLCFTQVIQEDVLAKSDGVMRYAEYAAAETGTSVVVEAYVLDHQTWRDGKVSVYAQDAEGGYFIYNMACSEEDAAGLVPGQKIRVSGEKAEWGREVEIMDGSFEFVEGSYQFRPVDLSAAWGSEKLIDHQNQLVAFKGVTVEEYRDKGGNLTGAAFAYKDFENKTDDLYFQVSRDGVIYEFCVEFNLCGSDTEVYKAVEALQVGDVVDLEGYLYWYGGPNLHVISLTVK